MQRVKVGSGREPTEQVRHVSVDRSQINPSPQLGRQRACPHADANVRTVQPNATVERRTLVKDPPNQIGESTLRHAEGEDGQRAGRHCNWRGRLQPAINVEALVADLRSLKSLSEKDPVAARESLRRVVETVVLTPVEGEYEATLSPTNYSAALAGGLVGDKGGCGGRI